MHPEVKAEAKEEAREEVKDEAKMEEDDTTAQDDSMALPVEPAGANRGRVPPVPEHVAVPLVPFAMEPPRKAR